MNNKTVGRARLTGLLGSQSEALAAHKGVEERGLADVGASDEGELREAIGGAILGPDAALDELGLSHLGVPGVLAQHDVRALEDPRVADSDPDARHVGLRRHEEPVEWGFDGGLLRSLVGDG